MFLYFTNLLGNLLRGREEPVASEKSDLGSGELCLSNDLSDVEGVKGCDLGICDADKFLRLVSGSVALFPNLRNCTSQ